MKELAAIGLVVFGSVLGGVGSFLLKKSSDSFDLNLFKQLKNFNLVWGTLLYGLASVVFILALQFADLSLLYPLTSLSYIWGSLLAVKYLEESMNKFKWTGIFFILLGAFLVTL